ncbi:outer membrane porin, OprD family [Pseudomonas sp. JM0905a]|uniref:OprD family porin n=1 Tax=Metapseudomonas resinovorans TaxID=53412 RepID=A0ABT4Y0W9_METRE|nr:MULTISPECIES: OprD family outer membrane porin [Pseudomonas]MBD2838038.1 outer membrane porin, OprD family [Pseudomonas sp. JM0905a]MDA8482468.1 OprD family porin [Pseudomonas resinovorans]
MRNVRCKYLGGIAGCLLAGSAGADGFIDDSLTTLRYSQFYWKENDGGGVGPTRDEWVQGAQFSFSSGWYADVLGMDYSYGLADDLNIGSDANSITNLEADDSVQSPHGLAKPIEAYLRSHLKGDAGDLVLGGGKKVRRYAQYFDDATRILPAATLGADADYRQDGLNLRYSHIKAFSPRNENGWGDDLTNFRGETIDNLQLFALGYQLPFGSRLLAEYAESKDYLRAASLKVEHSIDLGVGRLLDFYVTNGMQQDAGDLFEFNGVPGIYRAETSHDARYIDLSAKYKTANYYLGMTYNKVRGDDFDRVFFSKDHGAWNSSAKLFYFFGAEDEEMFKLMGGTNFSAIGVPQLRLDVHYAFSDHAAGYDGFSRREFQSLFQYNFDGLLRGLSLVWLHNEFHTKGQPDGIERAAASRGPAGIITHNAERFYLNYVYTF